jgi:uncharacterized protein YndB with AHSA1/START domain
MTSITVTRKINAPLQLTFKAIADIENLPKTNPDIVKIEFLTAQKTGGGTRFREIRRMGKKKNVTELEVTEYAENESIRMVADSHGTIWDSKFTVTAGETTDDKPVCTILNLTMDAKAHKFIPKLLNPLMKGLYKMGLEKHMDAIKNFCEKR